MADVYENISLAPVCEVAGPNDYQISISLYRNKGRWQHIFNILSATFVPKADSGIETAPREVNQMVLQKIWEVVKEDELMFYELDENGKKKFNGWQHHDPTAFLEKFKATCTQWDVELG